MPHTTHTPDLQHSEETTDFLGKMPAWIIRWGTTLLCTVFLVVIIGCCCIRYPQTVDGSIRITTVNPPADIITRASGKIDALYAAEGQTVRMGESVALLFNTASRRDMDSVQADIVRSQSMPIADMVCGEWLSRDYNLGEVQQTYEAFCLYCSEYHQYLQVDHIGRKKELLSQQIRKTRYYCSLLRQQQSLSRQDVSLKQTDTQRDSLLYTQGILSLSEYEAAVRATLQTISGKATIDASVTTAELELLQMEQQLIELDIQQETEKGEYERQITQSRRQLLAAIDLWNYKYVLTSPTDGKITYIGCWSSNQTIAEGDRLACITPSDSMQVVGRMSVPSASLGKIAVGQTVNVKLSGYPYMEYGLLKGKIRSVSAVPNQEQMYIAEVVFPDGLHTTYRKELNLIQQMDGIASVVTQDMRLAGQFLQPIRALFDKR